MWWPFAKRGTRVNAPVQLNLPVALPSDLGVFGKNDACIKIWLPEKLVDALNQLSESTGQSRPDVLRWLLFEHVYGRSALETLRAWKRQQEEIEAERIRQQAMLDREAYDSGIRFSLARAAPSERTYTAQLLGKSVEDFKLWLPHPLKNQLDSLSKWEELGLSDYLRKTLVRILLGESFHHQWRAAIGKLPAEVTRFEQEQ